MPIEPYISLDLSHNTPELSQGWEWPYGSYDIDYSFPLQPGIAMGLIFKNTPKYFVSLGVKYGAFRISNSRDWSVSSYTTMFSDSNSYKVIGQDIETILHEFSFPVKIRIHPIQGVGLQLLGGLELLTVTNAEYSSSFVGVPSEEWVDYLSDETSVKTKVETRSHNTSKTNTNEDVLYSYGLGWSQKLKLGTVHISVAKYMGINEIPEHSGTSLDQRGRTTISIEYSRIFGI